MIELAQHWALDPEIVFLNHGSYGACPRAVLQHQQALRERLEAEPARFFNREAPKQFAAARDELARFVGASEEGTAFVPNATSGINAVLRSAPIEAGAELLALGLLADAAPGRAGHRSRDRRYTPTL